MSERDWQEESERLRRSASVNYRVAPGLLREEWAGERDVIIELNVDYPGGLEQAKTDALALLSEERRAQAEALPSRHNIFVSLTQAELRGLAGPPIGDEPRLQAIYKIWADDELRAMADISRPSMRTIKAEACLTTFGADGTNIVVAVADSGIDGEHPHFRRHGNLRLPRGMVHRDFVRDTKGDAALVDPLGHGTHVAGIIAGHFDGRTGEIGRLRKWYDAPAMAGVSNHEESAQKVIAEFNTKDGAEETTSIRGVAPKARLLSLRVLDDNASGKVSRLIAALDYVYELNDSGRKLKVHCVNLSLGYPFDAEWYAAGQSPLCVMVNRLVRSGVVVVVAAGNHGTLPMQGAGDRKFTVDQTINDPGNAEEAITVGSTHAEAPHMYGVSFFSSRGPTADGRMKPDLLAPGEKILSCATGAKLAADMREVDVSLAGVKALYREDSGTSMAAAHVSGAVAAFLSIQGEFVNEPQRLKKVFMASCTDLGRKRDFQGAGLIDLMRAVQSV